MKNSILLFVTILSFSMNCSAQKTMVALDDEIQKKYVYVDVIKTYERIVAKGYKSIDLFEKIGNSYYFNCEMEKAANWYCELFALTTNLKPEYYYRYSESLKAIGENDKANAMLKLLVQKHRQNKTTKILKNKHHEK